MAETVGSRSRAGKRPALDAYDGMCFFGGLVFFAPMALLVRTQAGLPESRFFLLQALLSAVIALGELPTGRLTDRVGFRNSLVLSQLLLLAARVLLTAAFLLRSLPLFVLEAVAEGLSACLSSGTDSAYLYALWGEEGYLPRAARAANCGTAGFLLSTACCALLYRAFGLTGLLLASVLSGVGGLLCALLLRREGKTAPASREGPPLRAQLGRILRDRRALLFTALLSAFSVAWLLVNFFYAEKLQLCGLPLTWLSPVILGYSAGQMLAEPILRRCARCRKERLTALFCALGGGALLIFGWLRRPWAVLPLMLLLPLLLDLASLCLEERQNRLVDALGLEGGRAAALSAMNLGVNLVEVVSLFASSALAALGIGWCFALCGGLLLLGSAALLRH